MARECLQALQVCANHIVSALLEGAVENSAVKSVCLKSPGRKRCLQRAIRIREFYLASEALFKQAARTSEERLETFEVRALNVVSAKFSSNLGSEVDSSAVVLFLRSFDS